MWIIDASGDRVLVADDVTTKVSALCAIDPNAIVACSYSKKLVGWRKLGSSPERLALPHLDKVFGVCSPAPGAPVAPYRRSHWGFAARAAKPARPRRWGGERRR